MRKRLGNLERNNEGQYIVTLTEYDYKVLDD